MYDFLLVRHCHYSSILYRLRVISSSSSSSLFVQIKIHDANKEQMIKHEQDSKVEKPHLLMPFNRKKETQNLHNTLQLNTMEENITVIKTTMGVLAKDQVPR